MGNTIYAEALIGMTVTRAERFIKENTVYCSPKYCKYKISQIRVVASNDEDFCVEKNDVSDRLDVKIKDNVITEVY